MATLYGVNKSKSLTSPATLVEAPDAGKIKVMYDEYSCSAILGATDVIEFGSIPVGARILNVKVGWDNLGSTGAGVLGFASDTDALAASMTFTSAGQYIADSAIATNVALLAVLTSVKTVQLAMSAATTATSGKIKVLVEYAFV